MIALAARLLQALPQTQCTRCGYPDCAGYAQAIESGEAGINQCPPGGAEGVARLAAITGKPAGTVDPRFGIEGPRAVAVIDEAWCIGCTLCLDACPTDAIVGIHKRMHTVIEPHCTGCELCIPVCPVDCISLEVVTPGRSGWHAWSQAEAEHARQRYEARKLRGIGHSPAATASAEAATEPTSSAADRKRAIIEAALARARAPKSPGTPSGKP